MCCVREEGKLTTERVAMDGVLQLTAFMSFQATCPSQCIRLHFQPSSSQLVLSICSLQCYACAEDE